MAYRSDQDAQDEQTRARIVRIRGELHALESQIGVPRPGRRARWIWFGAGIGVGVALVGVVFAATVLVGGGVAQGAPDAAREAPDRREIDGELLRLHGEMQGCAPSGFTGRVQADVTFAGRTGAITDIRVVNQGATTLDPGMVTCIHQTFQRIGTSPFRAPSYLYRDTLEWRRGTLLPEPLGALDGL